MTFPEYEALSAPPTASVTTRTTNVKIVEEIDAEGEVAAQYEYFRSHFGRPNVPGILKCFATHPPLLRHMMALSESMLFSDGHLGRRHKEMIATFVSVENACHYCADSHGFFLRIHGGSGEVLDALGRSETNSKAFTPAEQALLTLAQKVNLNSSRITPEDTEVLRGFGWNELQIAEAIHITALFSTFNRVANAFGLESQGLLAFCKGQSSATDEASKVIERGTR